VDDLANAAQRAAAGDLRVAEIEERDELVA